MGQGVMTKKITITVEDDGFSKADLKGMSEMAGTICAMALRYTANNFASFMGDNVAECLGEGDLKGLRWLLKLHPGHMAEIAGHLVGLDVEAAKAQAKAEPSKVADDEGGVTVDLDVQAAFGGDFSGLIKRFGMPAGIVVVQRGGKAHARRDGDDLEHGSAAQEGDVAPVQPEGQANGEPGNDDPGDISAGRVDEAGSEPLSEPAAREG